MSGEVDLPTRLRHWALEEMHFYPHTGQALPSVDDFNMLCRGPTAAVWKWIINHVHSAETVRTVKGNLTLKSKTAPEPHNVQKSDMGDKCEDEKAKLLEQRTMLSREITSTLRDIGHLQTDVERIVSEIEQTDQDYEVQLSGMQNVRRKAALLQGFSSKIGETSAQYGEYTNNIKGLVEGVKHTAQKSQDKEEYYSRGGTHDQDTEEAGPALETASGKHVRECCEEIGVFLQETLKGTYGGDKAEFARRKEPLWRHVEEVTHSLSPDQILHALMENTQNTSTALRTLTSQVDVRRDAQNLRFQYDRDGEVKDLATPPSLLRSVNQLLQERATEHLARYIETQKFVNQSHDLQVIVSKLKSQIDQRLQKLYTGKPKDLKLARSMVEVELELEGCRASLHCLTTEAEKFKEVVNQSFKDRQELFSKYRRIQEFQQITEQKQSVIQVLVKQNINSKSRLDAQITEIEQYIERALHSHQIKVTEVTHKLQECVITEVKHFAKLSLPYLLFSNIDNALKTSVLDLSIHQLTAANIRPPLVSVLQSLKFPMFQAPEMVLRCCLSLQTEIEEVVYKLERERWADEWRRKTDGGDLSVIITELCDRVKTEDDRQLQKSLPLLQQKLTNLGAAMSHCVRTKESASAWWEQPGQSCVPWYTVDGKPLKHFLDQWKALATNLRQLIVDKS